MEILSFGKIHLSVLNEDCNVCVIVKDDDIRVPRFHLLEPYGTIAVSIGIYDPVYCGHDGHNAILLNHDDKINLIKWMANTNKGETKWRSISRIYNQNFLDREEIKNEASFITEIMKKPMPDYMLLPEK